MASVGGLQQARELLAAMKALDAQGERRGVVFGRDAGTGTAVKIGQQQLDETLAKFGKLQDLKQIDLVINVIGGQQAKEAQDRLRKSVSLQYGVTDPFQRVKEQVMALPEAIQREVNPAFVGLQARIERAAGSIDKFKAVSSRTFNKLAGDVNVAREAMSRLTVASEQANAAIARGPGAPPPELTRTLARNVGLNEALPTRPTFISQRDDAVELNARRVRSIERLMVLYARYESEQAQGGATAKTTRQFREQIQVVNGLADALNELVYASDASAFDELALQANKAVAVFSRLTPEASRGLVALQNHALGLLDSYRRTGEGVESATAAVKRFAVAADIRDSAQRIKQVGDSIGGRVIDVILSCSGTVEIKSAVAATGSVTTKQAHKFSRGDAVLLSVPADSDNSKVEGVHCRVADVVNDNELVLARLQPLLTALLPLAADVCLMPVQ
ncbi:MAG: hypothetical protein EB078_09015, partial [Proteobacteria bacterium]|nr:hypothetical protein [Pseudomonadota bacterium]